MSIFSRPATAPQTSSPLLSSEPRAAAWLHLKHRTRSSSEYFHLPSLLVTIFGIAFTATIAPLLIWQAYCEFRSVLFD
jgi:hypothetical protein